MPQILEKSKIRLDTALRIVFVGHVDHGKSTLVGRILQETGSVLPSRMKEVEAICKSRGMNFEYAFLLDALEEEQDQGVTIDVSQVLFKTKKRFYRVIDAPGHKEFLKNMVSGASTADVAILLIDAEEGLREQTRRHATILSLLGIKQILVAVNKMDLVGYDRAVFERVREEYGKHLKSLKLEPLAYVPLAAYHGENVASPSSKMPWYEGKPLLELLDSLKLEPPLSENLPLRLPLQDVYKFDKERIFAGRVESGTLSVGEEVSFLPSGKRGVVKSIEKWNVPKQKKASAGESVGFTLEDQIFVERGEVVCREPAPEVSRTFLANIFWMGNKHLKRGEKYLLKLTTEETECVVDSILRVVNSSNLEEISQNAQEVAKNEVAEIILATKKPVAFDTFDRIPETGRFVLVSEHDVRGGGIILKKVEHFSAI